MIWACDRDIREIIGLLIEIREIEGSLLDFNGGSICYRKCRQTEKITSNKVIERPEVFRISTRVKDQCEIDSKLRQEWAYCRLCETIWLNKQGLVSLREL